MSPRTCAVLAVLTALAATTLTVRRHRRLTRALAAERAARRLTDATHHRDLLALTTRLHTLSARPDRAVLADADQILDTALAAHHTQHPTNPPTEGGNP